MRRVFTDRIGVWSNIRQYDDYGGYLELETFVANSWANISTIRTDKLKDYGLDAQQVSVKIRLRSRADLDYEANGIFFVYKERKYVPYSVNPVDLENKELEVIALYTKTNAVFMQDTFDETFDLTFR